jgi:dimethylhistidine N-methyltransferase
MTALQLNFEPETAQFCEDVLHGLRQTHKTLPCKYLYDERGSKLFDQICDLPEYYPTRTETDILCEHANEMARCIGPNVMLVEYGSGSSVKTRILLDHLIEPAAYVPLDISREHLLESSACLKREFPHIPVLPVCADYTHPFELPQVPATSTAAFFPGSTIGNFTPEEAVTFLKGVAKVVGQGGGLLLGVDVWKGASILEPAYNDAAGVTAEFNLNLLRRINRELGGEFDLDGFRHKAVWNRPCSRIEMHLVSQREQRVRVAGEVFLFHRNESIVTEYSHKWRPDVFARLASEAGWTVERVWKDLAGLFSVQYLRAS